MKYELYLGLDPNSGYSKKETINYLLEQSRALNIDITIIETNGSFNYQREEGLLVIHLSNESPLIPISTHPIKQLGELYKKFFNQQCFILNGYNTALNVY